MARILLREQGERWLILTGSAGERALCESIRAACGAADRTVNAAGEIPLSILPAVLEQMVWLLTNDTGVAHIAYATGTPSLTLFWRSDPRLSGPIESPERHRVLYKGELCHGCLAGRCVYPTCAKAISVEEVLAMARPRFGVQSARGRRA